MEKKIKIDVITLHAVQNYGSVLQALATQEILKQHGCNVTIIDYVREDVRYENLVKKWSGGNPIKALAIIPTILRWKNVFQSFAKKYLDLSENTYTKFVLTDSFHATAFSLNLHTEPICVYPKEFGGRLESILRQTNTTQRHIDNYEDFDVVNRAVDFEQVDEILSLERNKASSFIDVVVEDILKQSKKGGIQSENSMH